MMSLPATARLRRATPIEPKPRTRRKLRLYVAAGAPNSERARANLSALRQASLLDAFDIEVVDVLLDPQRALADGVRMTPTLLEVTEHSVKRIDVPIRDPEQVLSALELAGPLE